MTTITYSGRPKRKRPASDVTVADMIQMGTLIASTDQDRPSLAGIWIDATGSTFRVSATDSYVLGHLEYDKALLDNIEHADAGFVPIEIAKLCTQGTKPWTLTVNADGVQLWINGYTIHAATDEYVTENVPRPVVNGDFNGLGGITDEMFVSPPRIDNAPPVTFGPAMAPRIPKLINMAGPMQVRHSNSDGLKPMIVEFHQLKFKHRIIVMPVRIT